MSGPFVIGLSGDIGLFLLPLIDCSSANKGDCAHKSEKGYYMRTFDVTGTKLRYLAAGVIAAASQRLVCGIAALGLIGVSAAPAGATVLSDLAAQMQPGEWRELTTNNFNQGDILKGNSVSGTILEYTDEATYNPLAKKVHIIGCVREGNYACSTTGSPSAGWIEYDEATNSWRRMPNTDINTQFHSYNHATVNPANGDYYYWEGFGSRRVKKYSGGVVTSLPAVNSSLPPEYTALQFFPERNALILVNTRDSPRRVHTYSLDTGQWTSQDLATEYAIHNIARYSAKHKLVFFGGGYNDAGTANTKILFTMDAQGTVKRVADAPVSMGISDSCPVHIVDPVSGNFLVMSPNGTIYEYDPVKNTWKTSGSHPLREGVTNQRAAATAIPEYGVIFIVKWNAGSSRVYLYKHSPGSPLPADTTPPAIPVGLNVQ